MILDFGDVVKTKFFENGVEYFIITDIEDFSSDRDDEEYVYEVMKIFPVQEKSDTLYLTKKELSLIGKGNDSEGRTILHFVNKERNKAGLKQQPDYMQAILENSKATQLVRIKKKQDDDTIRYDKLKTVDDCLDAMNDLDELHKNFGDYAYLQLKDVVVERLKKLS